MQEAEFFHMIRTILDSRDLSEDQRMFLCRAATLLIVIHPDDADAVMSQYVRDNWDVSADDFIGTWNNPGTNKLN